MSSLEILKAFKASFSPKSINIKDLVVKHSRASGKGGQNVNKLNTKVEIRVNYYKVNWIPKQVSIKSNYKTKEKELVVKSDRYRTQKQNYDDCIEKMYSVINNLVQLPGETSEETRERVTRHIQREKNKNLVSKQFLSSKKEARKDKS